MRSRDVVGWIEADGLLMGHTSIQEQTSSITPAKYTVTEIRSRVKKRQRMTRNKAHSLDRVQ
jgi:hypothetical protein